MRSFTATACCSIILSAILFGACKKNDDSPSSSDMLAGKWKTSSAGYDVNKNSAMDADETTPLSDTMSYYTIFDPAGSGVSVVTQGGATDTLTWFTWAIAGNDITTNRTKGNVSYISLSNTSTYHVDIISATDLRLSFTAPSGLNWQNYKKQ